MLKRIIVLILCINLFIGMTVSAYSVYSVNDDSKTGYDFLNELGILNNYDLEKIGSNSTVTRAEFVEKIMCAIKSNKKVYNKLPIFIDVLPAYKNYQSIMNAYTSGYISGNGSNFNPDDKITLLDAAVISLRILGYGDYCENTGGYPSGYLSLISRIDLIENLKINLMDYLTNEVMCDFILNVMSAPILDIKSIVDKKINVSNKDYQTLFNIYYDIYESRGIVEANSVTPLNYGDYYIENSIIVDGVRYKTTRKIQNEYLGYNARIFYKLGKNKSLGNIVYMSQCDNNILEISADDFISADSKYIKYLKNDKQKKVSLGVDTKYIYNGKALNLSEDYLGLINNLTSGNITFIDNNMDGKYNVIKIWSYKNLVFLNYNDFDKTIYNVNEKSENICLMDKDYVVTDSNGVELDFNDIKKYDILSVGESADKKFVKIIVSYNRVTGTVDEMSYKENKKYESVNIAGNVYDVSDTANEYINFKLFPGINGTFCMSYDYKLVYYFEIDGETVPGYLLSIFKENKSDSCNEVTAFMMLTDGEQKSFDFSDKVMFDGTITKTSEVYKTLMNNETRFTPKIVLYMLDDAGKIKYIDTDTLGIRESKNTLCKIRTKEDTILTYKSDSKNFGIKFWPGKNPIFFGAPEEFGENIDFDKFTIVKLNNDSKVKIELYSIGDDTVCYDICVAFGEYSDADTYIERGSNMAVVKKISTGVTDDGEILYKLVFYERTNEKNIYIDPKRSDKVSELNCGSIIRYGVNAKGYIGNWEVLYDSKTKTYPKADSYGYYTTGTKDKYIPDGDEFSFGYVYKVIDSYYILLTTKPEYINEDTPFSYPLAGGAYLIRKTHDDCEVVKISGDDIKDYVHFADEAYRGVAFVTYGYANSDKYFLFME